MPANYPAPTEAIQAIYVKTINILLRSYPVKDSPLNIRPAMVFVTAAWLILLGVLGMAPLPELPLNDKALHFFGLGIATFLIYFMIEAPESAARRVWFVRRAPLMFTLFTAFFVGGVISEIVQSLLPWKTFQIGDIVANLLGSSLFLYLAVLLNRRIRRRQEIALLYQPLGAGPHSGRGSGAAGGGPVWSYGDYEADAPRSGGRPQNDWDVEDDEDELDIRVEPRTGQQRSAGAGRGNELFAIGDEDGGDDDRAVGTGRR